MDRTTARQPYPADTNPRAVAVNPVTNKIYVANNGSDNVTVIDGSDEQHGNRIRRHHPYAVAVNPVTNKIYVANYGSNTFTVIDGWDNSTATVFVGVCPLRGGSESGDQ